MEQKDGYLPVGDTDFKILTQVCPMRQLCLCYLLKISPLAPGYKKLGLGGGLQMQPCLADV